MTSFKQTKASQSQACAGMSYVEVAAQAAQSRAVMWYATCRHCGHVACHMPTVRADCRTPKKRNEDIAKLAAANAAHAATLAASFAIDYVDSILGRISEIRILKGMGAYVRRLIELADEYIGNNRLPDHDVLFILKGRQAQQVLMSETPIKAMVQLMRHHQSCVPHFWSKEDVYRAITSGEGMFRPTYVERRVVPFLRLGEAAKFVAAHLEVLTGKTFSNMEECSVGIFTPDEDVEPDCYEDRL